MPALDVVIPTYNAAPAALAASIRSALACPDVQRVVVVDDGSAPAANPVLTKDEARRVVLLAQPNAGPSAARNAGVELVSAEYAVFLDDDDELLPTGIAAALQLAQREGAAAVVSAREETRAGEPNRFKAVPPEWAGRTLPRAADVFRPIALFGASGCLVARRVLDAGLRFDPSLKLGEDRDLLYRIAGIGPVGVCPVAAVRVRLHGGGGSGARATNLTSPAAYSRRVRDHIAIIGRHHSAETDEHLRTATVWLLNALARHGAPESDWSPLVSEALRRGWRVPLKARLRRWTRRRAGA
jgi:glycosyltransferase involved in cell wall biosynthesis